MKLTFKKPYLYASAIGAAALIALSLLFIFLPGGGEETAPTQPPQLINPTDQPTEVPTAAPTDGPTEPEPTEPPKRAFVVTSKLNVRKHASTSSQSVDAYNYGTEISILEETNVDGVSWGRTDKGWVCLSYVHIGDSIPPTEPPPTEPPVTEPPQQAFVVVAKLNIRKSASTSSKSVGVYTYGAEIFILEEKTVSGVRWGRTDEGWISLSYVHIGDSLPPTEPPTELPTEAPTEPPEPTEPPTRKPNPFDMDDFVKNGQFISCKKEKTAIGVDISSWQEDVDFEKLKAAGVDYVMIRAGFRSTAWSGKLNKDKYVEQNYHGAKAAGLKVGFYFYSQARTAKEAREEANYLLEMVKDWDVDLPLVCDWEYTSGASRVENVSRRNATDSVKAFCDTIQNAGYTPMFYTADYLVKYKLYIDELAAYGIWYADYRNYLSTDSRVDLWQYTAKGRVDGIQGYADLNVLFLENSIFAKMFKDE